MMRPRPGMRLTMRDVLVLMEIARLQVRGVPVTLRGLCGAMGWTGMAAADDAIYKLELLGLVHRERGRAGATVLTCQVELIPSAWSEARYREIVGEPAESHQSPHPARQAGADPRLWGEGSG